MSRLLQMQLQKGGKVMSTLLISEVFKYYLGVLNKVLFECYMVS